MQKIVLIGGSKSNVGKTTLARIILKLFPKTFVAIKITNNLIHGLGITKETFKTAPFGKDTYFLLENAKHVFWAKGDFEYINIHIKELIETLDDPVIVEGNIFYRIMKPSLFLFVGKDGVSIKEEAKKLVEVADFVIVNGDFAFNIVGNRVFVNLQKNLYSLETDFKEFLTSSISKL
ncbi:hypothetical protein [Caldisericum sp.]|uniref:hypothetical protein n=1 Tax=Caldisericum sp. TaxID=2499687 RepID=UPI003D09BADE